MTPVVRVSRSLAVLVWGAHWGCAAPASEPEPTPLVVAETTIPTPMPWGKIIDIEVNSALFMRHASGVWTVFGEAYYHSAGLGGAYPGIASPTRSPGLDGLESISVNFTYGCGLSLAEMRCWGENEGGQLGRPSSWTEGPAAVALPRLPVTYHAGDQLTGVIFEDGTLWQWGNDGIDDPEPWKPALQAGLPPMRRFLWQGRFISCAVDRDEEGWCWGTVYPHIDWSDLFLEAPEYDTDVPVRVPELDGAMIRIDVAGATMYLRSDGTVDGWGENWFGQLGTGDHQPYSEIVSISLGGTVVDLVGGADHACVLREEGQVFCWGSGLSGALGRGDYEDRDKPSRVVGLPDIRRLAAGSDITFALDEQGQVWYWGTAFMFHQTNVPKLVDLRDLFDSTNGVAPAEP